MSIKKAIPAPKNIGVRLAKLALFNLLRSDLYNFENSYHLMSLSAQIVSLKNIAGFASLTPQIVETFVSLEKCLL
jgi:hypothetical protein